jgi:hypothetical protein
MIYHMHFSIKHPKIFSEFPIDSQAVQGACFSSQNASVVLQCCTPGIAVILSCLNLAWFSRILRGAFLVLAKKSGSETSRKEGEVQHLHTKEVARIDDVDLKKDT